jgi:DNA-binding NarL/FixJ family response regulator
MASKRSPGDYMQPKTAAVGDALLIDRLTARQREVLQLIAESRTVKQIAQMLGISVKTAETHRAQIMERLGIHDLAGLVRYAIRAGLITPGE